MRLWSGQVMQPYMAYIRHYAEAVIDAAKEAAWDVASEETREQQESNQWESSIKRVSRRLSQAIGIQTFEVNFSSSFQVYFQVNFQFSSAHNSKTKWFWLQSKSHETPRWVMALLKFSQKWLNSVNSKGAEFGWFVRTQTTERLDRGFSLSKQTLGKTSKKWSVPK